jgi:hypothetical protein
MFNQQSASGSGRKLQYAYLCENLHRRVRSDGEFRKLKNQPSKVKVNLFFELIDHIGITPESDGKVML